MYTKVKKFLLISVIGGCVLESLRRTYNNYILTTYPKDLGKMIFPTQREFNNYICAYPEQISTIPHKYLNNSMIYSLIQTEYWYDNYRFLIIPESIRYSEASIRTCKVLQSDIPDDFKGKLLKIFERVVDHIPDTIMNVPENLVTENMIVSVLAAYYFVLTIGKSDTFCGTRFSDGNDYWRSYPSRIPHIENNDLHSRVAKMKLEKIFPQIKQVTSVE